MACEQHKQEKFELFHLKGVVKTATYIATKSLLLWLQIVEVYYEEKQVCASDSIQQERFPLVWKLVE